MNPYEKLMQATPRMGGYPPRSSSAARPPTANGGAQASGSRPASGTANARRLPPQKKQKPAISFQVRPRFRFDLPDPPMHPKMLLGRLSTASYARPVVSDIERDFRPAAVGADPTHALHANLLVDATRPRKPDTRRGRAAAAPPPELSVNDEVLLRTLLSARTSVQPLLNGKAGADGRRGSGAGGVGARGGRAGGAALNEMTAPWMRRMSYDEYFVGTPNAGRASMAQAKLRAQASARKAADDSPAARERRRNELLDSFTRVKKPMSHPDPRKSKLTVVRESPIVPDFDWLGSNLIALEFENEEALTTEERAKRGGRSVAESVCSMATISLADKETVRKPHEPPKKFLACYTPTDETLGKRKRGGNGDDELDEEDEKVQKGCVKKLRLGNKEQYEWFGEFAIKESKFTTSKGAKGGRSCFAVSERISKDGKKSVACLSKIALSWILSKRSFVEGTQRLGKEGLILTRDLNGKPVRMSEKKALISGTTTK